MDPIESLKIIYEPWKLRVAQEMRKDVQGREFVVEELDRYYDLLEKAIKEDDPGWLKPLLIDWAASRTETDLTADEITLAPVLNQIATAVFHVANEVLSPNSANQLMAAYLPIVYYSYEAVARHETLVRIGYYSARLEKVTAELSRLDKSKSHFIAVAAHELKTPLTLIEGYSAMLEEEFQKTPSAATSKMLIEGVNKGLKRLGEMVNDMIDVSMIDNDMLSLRFQPTWISQILSNLEEEVQPSLNQRSQTLEVVDFEGFKEMIIADTERIQQAIRNVLSNAIKYTPNQGKIVIDGRLLSGFLEIKITDTGIGISPENQMTIFDKFIGFSDPRLHSSSKTNFKGGGPGLGLPIAKGILEAHGGSIWVESDGHDEDRLPGATFHLLLPLRKEPPDEQMSKLFSPNQVSSPKR